MRYLPLLVVAVGLVSNLSMASVGALTWGSVKIKDNVATVPLLWQADAHLAGFQFDCAGKSLIWAGDGEVEELGWATYYTEVRVLSFAQDIGTYIPPQSDPTHLVSLQVPLELEQLELTDIIFSDPNAQEIKITGPGILDLNPPNCPGDVSGDSQVGVDDILAILEYWGVSDGGDATGDGITDVNDILAVISAWGPCP